MAARPLIVRCGAFGDVVMLTPLISLLAARYGNRVDVVGSGAWTQPILCNDPALGDLQLIRSRNTPYWFCPSQWALVRWLRQRGRGPVYLCDVNPKMRALLLRGGVPDEDIVERLPDDHAIDGVTQLWPDRWMALGVRDPAHPYPARHDIDPHAHRYPRLHVGEAARADLGQWRATHGLHGPLVLLQAGNKRTHKRGTRATRQHAKYWPPQRWADIAGVILETMPAAQVVLCGSPNEHAMVEEIRAAGGSPRIRNMACELPIPRLLALIEQAHSMVSVDTGPAHAAAALGCPSVVLFGAASPDKWRPLGKGTVLALGGGRGEQSRVDDIASADVIAAWRSLPARA